MEAGRINQDDAELIALQTAMTEFLSQLDMGDGGADETPSSEARTSATLGSGLNGKPVVAASNPIPGPVRMRTAAQPQRVPARTLSASTWRKARTLGWGVAAVVLAACGTGVGVWLAGASRAHIDAPPRLVAQTAPQARTPPPSPRPVVPTALLPAAVVQPALRPGLLVPTSKAPAAIEMPRVRRAPTVRLPLPAPVVAPPSSPVSLATLARPAPMPTVSELAAPPGAITPPSVIYQELPRPRATVDQTVSLMLVILINKHGGVDRAFIDSMPILPWYERQLLAAAKTWRYTPALQNGRAVPCRQKVRVTLTASRSRG